MIGKKSNKKRMRNGIFFIIILIIGLITRVGYIQFMQGTELKEK